MRHNWAVLLFVFLLVGVFLAGLWAQGVSAVFGSKTHINGPAVALAWGPDTIESAMPCAPLPVVDQDMPGSDSAYILGLQALSLGDPAGAKGYFTQAVEQQGHPLALVFLANMSAEPVEEAIYAGPWTDEMRLSLVEYYLTIAGRCQLAGEQEIAGEYLARSEAFLPPSGITELPLGLARNAGALYVRDENWQAALPWLEHAAQANDASLLRLAYTYYRLDRLEEAAATYDQALVYYPRHRPTRLRAAQVWIDRSDIPAAIAVLSGMADPLELGVEGLLLWAELCAQTGDVTCQETQYQRVLTIDPQNETATTGLQALQP